jgi:competence protein ComFC
VGDKQAAATGQLPEKSGTACEKAADVGAIRQLPEKSGTACEKAADFILDIFFPNRCPCCNEFLTWNAYVCEKCGENLVKLLWDKQGYNIPENCEDVFAAFRYDGAATDALYAFKFAADRNFPRLCADILSDKITAAGFDAIVAVPMGKKRRRQRGYNQADVFAKYLSKSVHLPIITSVLFRKNETEQHKLTADNRFENAGETYGVCKNPPDIAGKRIILADDVETTGATLTACAELLKQAGAAAVAGAVCVKTVR